MNIPCVNSVTCECEDSPILNLSAEETDRNRFLGVRYKPLYPPPISWWYQTGCLSICWSSYNQAAADACAAAQSASCPPPPPPPPCSGCDVPPDDGCTTPGCVPVPGDGFAGTDTYYSQAFTCESPCPDGTISSHTVPAGRATSQISQEAADAMAQSICWNELMAGKMCFMDALIPPCCVNAAFLFVFGVSGGTAPVTFAIDPAELPPGLTLDPAAGIISGTPILGGVYPMTVTVTDSSDIPIVISKVFEIYVIEIVTSDPMPDGTVGTAYSESISGTGVPLTHYWTVTSGSLPDGLVLNPVTGDVTGTPTLDGTFDFRVALNY